MLHNFDPDEFLAKHWQKAPCLIKQAFSRTPNYLTAEELAGLSLEDEIESRVISNIDGDWRLSHGPFSTKDFQNLPESHWTLLVQTLDHWLPELQALVDQFKFIPNWRFDDVMVSYATDQGGVGPHFDNYDVFLIQGSGERRWRVGALGDTKHQCDIVGGLRHLSNFSPVIDVVMQPGDMLYIPPDTPHWGESIGESIGYSIGYRAPQTKDLLALLADHFQSESTDDFFADRYRVKANSSQKLETELIDWASNKLRNISENQELIASLLSQFLSQGKLGSPEFDEVEPSTSNANPSHLQLNPRLKRNWYQQGSQVILSIDGETFTFKTRRTDLVAALAAGEEIDFKGLSMDQSEVAFCETLARIKDIGYFLNTH
ncbi:hypothetical protein FLL45_04055 [Aliikangiella marina]|uniref:JmjC domain-containing protein n=1 Tax=Aliikangiella marina TaxID=1712262 RepID=A0A545TIS9_9GAMM|nr:cupin domain-containing protein [Aliikangiella marina]TQV77132.1 hypothetical protein FLL45_04055 [Aliikangiella marina]